MIRAGLVAVCVAALAAGCGASSSPSPGVDVPAGFTVRVVKDQGFSIALPTHWLNVLVTRIPSQIPFDRWKSTEVAEKSVNVRRYLGSEDQLIG